MEGEKTGTREWAEATVNLQLGCENDCRYCYARDMMVRRFGKCTAEEWRVPQIQLPAATRTGRNHGRVMFPSAHDITPGNISESLLVIRRLLESGNEVLVVTKPSLECTRRICEVFGSYRDRLLFRFTIGSVEDRVLRFWDRRAPLFAERLDSLAFAFNQGFATSVSCEPYLDPYPWHVYEAVEQYVTDTVWFGLVRDWKNRMDLSRATLAELQLYAQTLHDAQRAAFVCSLFRMMRDKPKVRWKDSIRKVMGDGRCDAE